METKHITDAIERVSQAAATAGAEFRKRHDTDNKIFLRYRMPTGTEVIFTIHADGKITRAIV